VWQSTFLGFFGKKNLLPKKELFSKMVIKIISMKVLKLWIFVDGYCIKIYNYGKIISKIISKMRRFYGRI
jgi:hypothetical protein